LYLCISTCFAGLHERIKIKQSKWTRVYTDAKNHDDTVVLQLRDEHPIKGRSATRSPATSVTAFHETVLREEGTVLRSRGHQSGDAQNTTSVCPGHGDMLSLLRAPRLKPCSDHGYMSTPVTINTLRRERYKHLKYYEEAAVPWLQEQAILITSTSA